MDAIHSDSIHLQDPVRLDSDITLNTYKELLKFIVIEWSSTDIGKCLECLAILKEVILVSIEIRMHAW